MTYSSAELSLMPEAEIRKKITKWEQDGDTTAVQVARRVLESRSGSSSSSNVHTPASSESVAVKRAVDDDDDVIIMGEVKRAATPLAKAQLGSRNNHVYDEDGDLVMRSRENTRSPNDDDLVEVISSTNHNTIKAERFASVPGTPGTSGTSGSSSVSSLFKQPPLKSEHRSEEDDDLTVIDPNSQKMHSLGSLFKRPTASGAGAGAAIPVDKINVDQVGQPGKLSDAVIQRFQYIKLVVSDAETTNLISRFHQDMEKSKRNENVYQKQEIQHSQQKMQLEQNHPNAIADPMSPANVNYRFEINETWANGENAKVERNFIQRCSYVLDDFAKSNYRDVERLKNDILSSMNHRKEGLEKVAQRKQQFAVHGYGATGGHGGLYNNNNNQVPTLFQNQNQNQRQYTRVKRDNDDDVKVESDAVSKLIQSKFDHELAPEKRENTPPEMKSTLLEHQKIGLTWLLAKEKEKTGCILADDMGLGKTVQTIALILANKSTDNDCKTTLIIAPVALMQQWADEIARHVKPEHRLKVYIHHRQTNPKILTSFDKMKKYDVVITTYEYASNECRKYGGLPSKDKEKAQAEETANRLHESCLFGGKWYRIVLDEAQNIKNRSANRSIAVAQFLAEHRLCLSGTPMQNDVQEYFPFMRFLEVKPYDDWSQFSSQIARGLDKNKKVFSASAMKRLQALISRTLLRRTKTSTVDGRPILTLPTKTIDKLESPFDNDQEEYYRGLEAKAQVAVNKYLNLPKERRGGHNYSSVLTWLLRLRQACCHPILVEKSVMKPDSMLREGSDEVAVKFARQYRDDVIRRVTNWIEEGSQFDCPICLETPEHSNVVLTSPCGHPLCGDCASELYMKMNAQGSAGKCVSCQTEINPEKYVDLNLFKLIHIDRLSDKELADIRKEEAKEMKDKENKRRALIQKRRQEQQQKQLNDELFEEMSDAETDDERDANDDEPKEGNAVEIVELLGMDDLFPRPQGWITSSKIEKCMDIISNVMESTTDEKVLIFSQFTSFLDLMAVPMVQRNFEFLRYDGSMNSKDRSDTVKKFMDEPEFRVMFVSLRAGNVGLTLTAANHVIVLDPFWNPYVEDQAVDRAYRIGQQRDVHVHRLVVTNTVEDRILKLQEQKRELIDAALDEGELRRNSRLGHDELRYIFGIGQMPNNAGARDA